MNRALFLGSIALAFVAGSAATQLFPRAIAADTMMTAQVLHVPELQGDALGPANQIGFRSKMFVAAEGMTVSVQAGNVPKHLHPDAHEIQYILEGTGTVWLDEKEIRVKPGDLVVIPKGTPHGGTKPDAGSAPIKAIALKTPPQAAEGGTKMLP